MEYQEEMALQLLDAHARGERFSTLLQANGQPLRTSDAYSVQEHFVRHLQARAQAPVVGYKIGLTSAVMQKMCGIDSPIYGAILGSRVHASGCVLHRSAYGRLGLEFEIAVRLGRDIEVPPSDLSEMTTCVDAICAAIELVDDRSASYDGLDAASLIADNSWNAGVVLGRWLPPPQDLPSRNGRVAIDAVAVDTGRVGDALDHPFESVRWLAAQLAQTGRALRAGMIVMTGSIVQTRFPSEPGRWVYEVDGMGTVEVDVR